MRAKMRWYVEWLWRSAMVYVWMNELVSAVRLFSFYLPLIIIYHGISLAITKWSANTFFSFLSSIYSFLLLYWQNGCVFPLQSHTISFWFRCINVLQCNMHAYTYFDLKHIIRCNLDLLTKWEKKNEKNQIPNRNNKWIMITLREMIEDAKKINKYMMNTTTTC